MLYAWKGITNHGHELSSVGRFYMNICLLLACSFWGATKAEAATKIKTHRMDVNVWWGKPNLLTLFFFTLHNHCHHLNLAVSEPMSQSGISERWKPSPDAPSTESPSKTCWRLIPVLWEGCLMGQHLQPALDLPMSSAEMQGGAVLPDAAAAEALGHSSPPPPTLHPHSHLKNTWKASWRCQQGRKLRRTTSRRRTSAPV